MQAYIIVTTTTTTTIIIITITVIIKHTDAAERRLTLWNLSSSK
jgi:hypothetical protein